MKLEKRIFHYHFRKTFLRNAPILFILVIGFLWRLYYSHIAVVRGDETLYLYQAYQINNGMIPFKDFYCRSPLYLYFLALSMRIFGTSISAARLSLVIASTFNIYLIHHLGTRLHTKKTGLFAAAFFAFSPYTIRIGSMLVTEVLLTLILTLVMIIIVKALNEGRISFFLIAGIITGLSFYVRRTGVLFLIIIPLLIFLHHLTVVKHKNYHPRLLVVPTRDSVLFCTAAIATGVGLFLLFVSISSWDYMMESFFAGRSSSFDPHNFTDNLFITAIPGDLINYSFFSVSFFIIFIAIIIGRNSDHRIILYRAVYPMCAFYLIYFITPFRSPPREILTGELFDLLTIFLLVIAALPIIRFRDPVGDENGGFVYLKMGAIAIFLFLFAQHLLYYVQLWSQVIFGILVFLGIEYVLTHIRSCVPRIFQDSRIFQLYRIRVMVIVPLVMYFLLFIDESIYNQQEKTYLNICILSFFPLSIFLSRFLVCHQNKYLEIVVLLWLIPVFLLYTYWGFALDFYYYEFMVPLSIGSAFVLKGLIDQVPRDFRPHLRALIAVALVSILLSHSINVNTFEQQGNNGLITPDTSEKVAGYLRERTSEGEEAFSADQTIIISAGLRIPFDISDPFFYRLPSAFPDQELINYPTIEEIQQHLLEKPVRYCIVGPSTVRLYFEENPGLKEFIFNHYIIETTINNVDIYKLKGDTQ